MMGVTFTFDPPVCQGDTWIVPLAFVIVALLSFGLGMWSRS